VLNVLKNLLYLMGKNVYLVQKIIIIASNIKNVNLVQMGAFSVKKLMNVFAHKLIHSGMEENVLLVIILIILI